MNNINKFSFARVGRLITKHIGENRRLFIMYLLVLFGSLAIGTVIISELNLGRYKYYIGEYEHFSAGVEMQLVYFFFMFFILGLVYVSFAFNDMKNKAERTAMLTLPAKTGEKYLSRFVVYMLAFPILFFAAMWVADAFRVVYMLTIHSQYSENVHFMTWNEIRYMDPEYMVAWFAIFQSFYWLGAIVWPKNSFVKTFAFCFCLNVFYAIAAIILYYIIIGDHSYQIEWLQELNPEPLPILVGVTIVVCVINYSLAYMRLKETQVIQRLL